MPTKYRKVALVHDWLTGERGGEKVLEELCSLYPQAEIFTLFHKRGCVSKRIEKHRIHTSFLNKFPQIERYYRYLLPLFPLAIERFNLNGFDLVVSSSHCVAKGVVPPPSALHVCYCHTPVRYAWDAYTQYFSNKITEKLFFPFIHYLRMWDVSSSARVDQFIANSKFVQNRIKKYYRRKSAIIHPPVDTHFFSPQDVKPQDYYLVVSAFAPYKRIEQAIKACRQLGRKLVIVGEGQNAKQLRALRSTHTRFVGWVPKESLRKLYSQAKALLYPGIEDFGITPLEAQACGTPVIAYGEGGALETVRDGVSGILYAPQNTNGLVAAIKKFESSDISSEACRKNALEFGYTRFRNEIKMFFTGPKPPPPALPSKRTSTKATQTEVHAHPS